MCEGKHSKDTSRKGFFLEQKYTKYRELHFLSLVLVYGRVIPGDVIPEIMCPA